MKLKKIAALRQSSDKNHQDLKIEFLTFKTNILTQIRAMDQAIKATNTNLDCVQKKISDLELGQNFVSTNYEDLKIKESNLSKKHRENEKLNEALDTKINDTSALHLLYFTQAFSRHYY